jgi:hypothetical protein
VEAGKSVFAGQFGSLPVQFSAISQGPADSRHTVGADAKLSVGQAALVPSQTSAMSHGPAAARQIAPFSFGVQAVWLVPGVHCWQWLDGLVSPAA